MTTKGTLAGVLGGFSMCALTMSAMAQGGKPTTAVDAADAPGALTPPTKVAARAAQSSGGIAGTSPIVWDNGPLVGATCTGTACTTAQVSLLQNTSLGLNILGFGAQTTANNIMADDFTLTQTTDLQEIEFYMYQTNTVNQLLTAPTITAVNNVRLHSSLTATVDGPTSNVLQGPLSGGVVTLTTIARAAEAATFNCSRHVQKITLDVSAWPDLAPGTYWISWNAAGSLASGPWQPSVVECGQCSKPGANGLQSLAGANFTPALDTLGGAGCENAPQDAAFIIRGDVIGTPTCPGDTDGDSDVDADDLTNVILQWGTTCPCTADVDDDNDVDSDDLTVVILEWGTAC
jgi:hypothetical protein